LALAFSPLAGLTIFALLSKVSATVGIRYVTCEQTNLGAAFPAVVVVTLEFLALAVTLSQSPGALAATPLTGLAIFALWSRGQLLLAFNTGYLTHLVAALSAVVVVILEIFALAVARGLSTWALALAPLAGLSVFAL
jgi:hypothetical protein